MQISDDEVMNYVPQTKMGFQQTYSPQMQEIIELLAEKYKEFILMKD